MTHLFLSRSLCQSIFIAHCHSSLPLSTSLSSSIGWPVFQVSTTAVLSISLHTTPLSLLKRWHWKNVCPASSITISRTGWFSTSLIVNQYWWDWKKTCSDSSWVATSPNFIFVYMVISEIKRYDHLPIVELFIVVEDVCFLLSIVYYGLFVQQQINWWHGHHHTQSMIRYRVECLYYLQSTTVVILHT